MMESATLREQFEEFLARFHVVKVFVAPLCCCDVPRDILDAGKPFCLDYGLDMPRPIPDLETDERGIKATLSFGGEPVGTFVPWAAIIAAKGAGDRAPKARLRSVS
jgi:hypothetical protein